MTLSLYGASVAIYTEIFHGRGTSFGKSVTQYILYKLHTYLIYFSVVFLFLFTFFVI